MLRRRRRRLGSRSTRNAALLLVALLAAALAQGCQASTGGPSAASTATARLTVAPTGTPPAATFLPATPTPASSIALPPIHPDPARLQRAEVVHIVDGDTIDVRIGGTEERVRYYGSDTTERGQACFSEATRRNEQLAGRSVQLLPDARNRDRYGRLLRYVFDDSGTSVDAMLIAEGLAHAWRQDGAYRDQLVALEAQAQSTGVGCLWSRGAP